MSTDPTARPPLDRTGLADDPRLGPDLVVEVLDQAPSTNAVVAVRAHEGARDGLVVVADHQSQGRGRMDRVWETPPGTAITFSLLLRPQVPTRSWPWLPLLTGYAVTKALRAEGYDAGVKWPNDVLIGDRKVAGILVERVETPDGPAAVLGVGLNTATTESELPAPTATSLLLESGTAPDRTDLLVTLLSSLREAYDAWAVGGDLAGMRLLESYTSACVTIGQDVRVDLPGGQVLAGRATGIDPTGQLLLETAHGSESVGAGDVVHVRRA